jgi:predicted nuclease of predicted toxin-antitoxin system
VKLLLDQNISYRLARRLSDEATDVTHVRDHRLQSADDETIWNFAAERHLTIVSKTSGSDACF